MSQIRTSRVTNLFSTNSSLKNSKEIKKSLSTRHALKHCSTTEGRTTFINFVQYSKKWTKSLFLASDFSTNSSLKIQKKSKINQKFAVDETCRVTNHFSTNSRLKIQKKSKTKFTIVAPYFFGVFAVRNRTKTQKKNTIAHPYFFVVLLFEIVLKLQKKSR